MTPEQQYKALAAMLPEQIYLAGLPGNYHLRRPDNNDSSVLKSELLSLCHEIEDGLTTREQLDYVQALKRGWCSPFYNWTHASAERRIEALAKVKGIK